MKSSISILLVTILMMQGAGLLSMAAPVADSPMDALVAEDIEAGGAIEHVVTFGHSRLSRDYEDLSSWKGVSDDNVSVSYLILTASSFVDQAKPLAQWKTEKGLNTAIVTTESIYNKYTGQDAPQKIHNYLRDFRDNNPTFKWLLILGDAKGDSPDGNTVPTRHLWTGGDAANIDWYIMDSTVSDFYYSALDSSWNLDGDDTWGESGEVDWNPDVYVGRIPVDNTAEVTFNLNKVLDYEKAPIDGPWMNRALLGSGLYDVPNIIGDYDTRTDHGYYEWWQDNGKEGIDIVESYIPSTMQLKTLHDYNVSSTTDPPYEGGSWSKVADELNQTSWTNEFLSGYSIMASATHAWVNYPSEPDAYYSRAVIHYDGNGSEVDDGGYNWSHKYKDMFNATQAEDIANQYKLPLWYASACLVGNFSQEGAVPENTLERFFKNQNGGVIGLVSATHGDYRGEQNDDSISDGDTWLLHNFFDVFFDEGEQRPGKTLYTSKVAYRDHLANDLGYNNQVMDAAFARDSLFVYNLMGDPEVPVWTDIPGTLTAEMPTEVVTGPQEFEITVTDSVTSLPVQNAMVALMGDNDGEQVYTWARTDALGKATLETDAAGPDNVEVTVTALNYRYWKGEFNISWKPGDLYINTANVTFSEELVKVGEDLDISAKVFNVGESPLTNILVGFYHGDPGAGGTEIGTKTIASLNKDQDATVKVTWPVADGRNMICVIVDPADAIAEYDEYNNKACKQMDGTSKDLTLSPPYITFEDAIVRGDGMPMVGNNTTVNIMIKVENKGTTNVTLSYVRLFDGDPDAGGERIGISDYRVDDVPPAGFRTIKVPWNVSGAGVHTIYALSDPNDAIKEFEEGNNNASTSVYSDLPPTLDPIDDIVLEEDDPTGEGDQAVCMYTLVDDPDNTYDELNVHIISNTNPNVWLNITAGCLDIMPKPDFYGFTLVTMGVNDTIFEVTRSFMVTIDPVNDAPVITNPGTVTAQEGETFDLTIEVTDPDDGDSLTFTDTSDMFDINPTTGRIYFTPVRNNGGSHVINITVSDGTVNVSVNFIMNVGVNNRAPILTIKEDEWVFEVGKSKKYTFTMSDPDGDALTVSDNFMHADVNQAGYLAWKPTKAQKDTYIVTITVTDGFTNTSKMVKIKVVDAQHGGVGEQGFPWWILILIIIVVVVIAGVAAMRSRDRKPTGHEQEYDSLYGDDERQKAEVRREERRREREARRREEAEDEEAYEEEGEEAAGPAVDCPKCGSAKVMEMEDGEWMCLRCSKVFK